MRKTFSVLTNIALTTIVIVQGKADKFCNNLYSVCLSCEEDDKHFFLDYKGYHWRGEKEPELTATGECGDIQRVCSKCKYMIDGKFECEGDWTDEQIRVAKKVKANWVKKNKEDYEIWEKSEGSRKREEKEKKRLKKVTGAILAMSGLKIED